MKRDGALIRAQDLQTVSDAAMQLGVSTTYIYRLMRQCKVDYYEIGARKLVHRRDIDLLAMKRAS